MAEVQMTVGVAPSRVFAVLSDGWSYPLWVVGAAHMRDVDEAWPQVGSRIHHKVGAWPLLIEDNTEVVDMRPDRRLELDARAWPAGRARVVLTLDEVAGGTSITMEEHAAAGPAQLLPRRAQDAMLVPRNNEALRRLEQVAVNRPY
ncbi:SRPBCC family protein [Pseudonocardia sp.]|jgi:hypothetical protein|uniref:SRPBCC family protein n=1 Tax=Pseudonocardia sp. TaxID=60912 RepID=UPI002620EFE3|nr:SRPBCC family protein [Pseudonocardia sp.]MCW2718254.1 Polyketide cyclase/dehydrase [Pseudonocardia sp.]MDT7618894.1 hypothetical protein [Pseudonocardiales bacterium]